MAGSYNGKPRRPEQRESVDIGQATTFMLPTNIEAERAVIGSLLQELELLPVCREHLRLGDAAFANPTLRLIYRAIEMMAERIVQSADRTPESDAIMLLDALKRIDPEHRVTWQTFAQLVCEVPSRERIGIYGDLLQEAALDRALIGAAYETIMQAKHKDGDLRSRLACLGDAIAKITAGLQRNDTTTLASVVAALFPGFESELKPAAINSPWPKLDEITGGWHGSELVVPAARPGVGKTSLLVNVAEHVLHLGGRVLFFSLEMSAEQLTHRFLSLLSQVPVRAFFRRNLSRSQSNDVHTARLTIDRYGSNLLIDDNSSTTIDDIRARAAVKHAQKPLACVMVDYLQLVRSTGTYDRRDLEVAAVARGLKALAKDLNVPVLATAQVRREVDDASKPRLRDLRESGDIESAADQVIFMLSEAGDPDAPNDAYKVDKMTLVVAKNRHGPTGECELTWIPASMELKNMRDAPSVAFRDKPVEEPAMTDWTP